MATNTNAALLHKLLVEAETVACLSSQNKFPILLRPIAERRKVTGVEFCTLLVDAMLTTHPDGFRILFNANNNDPIKLKLCYQNETPDNLLPPRLRFSLAHELAHTFFYDLSPGRPEVIKAIKSGGRRTALDNLETSCNKIAAHLLLPSPLLKREIKSCECFYPASVISLANRAGVSVEALIRRLNETPSLFLERSFYGCVILLREWEGQLKISALAKPKNMMLASELSLLRTGEIWSLTACDGTPIRPERFLTRTTIPLTVQTAQSNSIGRYKVEMMPVNQSAQFRTFLMTFEQVRD